MHPLVPMPADEEARLEALRRYEILDTPPEPAFDDLMKLAAHVCDAPMGSLTLIDADRQWFKTKVGFDATETPRDGFCSHAILQTDLLVVRDAWDDQRFRSHPFVIADPHARFYAGVTLVTPDGFAIGTLCVLDTQPRDLTSEQADALRALGRQAMSLLELRLVAGRERRRVDELHAVQEMAARILSRSDLEQVLAGIASGICRFTGSTRAAILDYDPEIAMLEGLANHGIDSDQTGRDVTIPLDDCPSAGRAIITGRPAFSDGLPEENRAVEELVGTQAYICVPLRAGANVFGVVFLDRPRGTGRLSPEQEDSCMSFAMLAGVALDHAHRRLHEPRDRVPATAKVHLSAQEVSILRLAAEGLSNPEIGEKLFLSKHTVKEYFGNAMRKLGVSSRVEAVLEATRLGFIPLGEPPSPGRG